MRLPRFYRPTRPLWAIAAIASLVYVGYQYYKSYMIEAAAKHTVPTVATNQENTVPFTSMAQAIEAQNHSAGSSEDNLHDAKRNPNIPQDWRMKASGLQKTPRLSSSSTSNSYITDPANNRE